MRWVVHAAPDIMITIDNADSQRDAIAQAQALQFPGEPPLTDVVCVRVGPPKVNVKWLARFGKVEYITGE